MSKHAFVLLALLLFTIPGVIAETPDATSGPSSVPLQPQAGSWATMAPMPTARTELGVAVVDGKIYAVGGTTQTQADFPRTRTVGANEMYDPGTDTWTTKATMPIPMSDFAIAAYQGKIYCFKGSVLEIYDPATDSWINKTTPTVAEVVHANVANDKIYLIGDIHELENGNFTTAYDPQTNSFTTKAPIQLTAKQPVDVDASPPIPDLFATPYVDTRGFSDSRGATVSLETGEIFWVGRMKQGTLLYNPNNNVWHHCTAPPPSYVRPYAVAVTTGEWAPQELYILNEEDSAVLNSLVFAYNSTTDQWDKCTYIPSSRTWYSVAVVDDQLYVIGGETSRGMIWYDGLWLKVNTSNMTERYTPADYGTVAPPLSVLSPQNGTAVSDNSALNASVNGSGAQATYSSDGQDNVTAHDNSTLNQLAEGAHNTTENATDDVGNVDASKPVYFTEETQPFPVLMVAAVSVVVAVCVAAVLVYLKKKKHAQTSLSPL